VGGFPDGPVREAISPERVIAASGLFPSNMEFMMSKIISAVKSFVADENGVTALEYGMIAALIGAVIVTVVGTLGTTIKTKFNDIVTALTATTP
jgi:pilus assembly protein Flp/PilA